MPADADIVRPDTRNIEALVRLWSMLVRSQRAFGTRVLAEENRNTAQEWLAHLVAIDGIRGAAVDGQLVGFVSFEMELDRFARSDQCGIVHNLYVVEAFRDRGIGSRLLDRAERLLRQRGADRVRLEVMATNDRAADFYVERGYRPQRIRFHKPLDETDNHNSSGTEG